LSKKDKLYKDAMQTAADCKDCDVAEDLLDFFVSNGLKECFAATLYVCYEVLRPDVILELAWKNGLMDFAMPFMIQTTREYMTKIDALEKEVNEQKAIREKQQEAPVMGGGMQMPLMLTAGPGSYGGMPGQGMYGGGY